MLNASLARSLARSHSHPLSYILNLSQAHSPLLFPCTWILLLLGNPAFETLATEPFNPNPSPPILHPPPDSPHPTPYILHPFPCPNTPHPSPSSPRHHAPHLSLFGHLLAVGGAGDICRKPTRVSCVRGTVSRVISRERMDRQMHARMHAQNKCTHARKQAHARKHTNTTHRMHSRARLNTHTHRSPPLPPRSRPRPLCSSSACPHLQPWSSATLHPTPCTLHPRQPVQHLAYIL